MDDAVRDLLWTRVYYYPGPSFVVIGEPLCNRIGFEWRFGGITGIENPLEMRVKVCKRNVYFDFNWVLLHSAVK